MSEEFKFVYEKLGYSTEVDGKQWIRTQKLKSAFIELTNPVNEVCELCPFAKAPFNNKKEGGGMTGIIQCSQQDVVGKNKQIKIRLSFPAGVDPTIQLPPLYQHFKEIANCTEPSNIDEIFDDKF